MTSSDITHLSGHLLNLSTTEVRQIKQQLGLQIMRGLTGGKNIVDHAAHILDHLITHPSQQGAGASPAAAAPAPAAAPAAPPPAPPAAPPPPPVSSHPSSVNAALAKLQPGKVGRLTISDLATLQPALPSLSPHQVDDIAIDVGLSAAYVRNSSSATNAVLIQQIEMAIGEKTIGQMSVKRASGQPLTGAEHKLLVAAINNVPVGLSYLQAAAGRMGVPNYMALTPNELRKEIIAHTDPAAAAAAAAPASSHPPTVSAALAKLRPGLPGQLTLADLQPIRAALSTLSQHEVDAVAADLGMYVSSMISATVQRQYINEEIAERGVKELTAKHAGGQPLTDAEHKLLVADVSAGIPGLTSLRAAAAMLGVPNHSALGYTALQNEIIAHTDPASAQAPTGPGQALAPQALAAKHVSGTPLTPAEHQALVAAVPGLGTFAIDTLATSLGMPNASQATRSAKLAYIDSETDPNKHAQAAAPAAPAAPAPAPAPVVLTPLPAGMSAAPTPAAAGATDHATANLVLENLMAGSPLSGAEHGAVRTALKGMSRSQLDQVISDLGLPAIPAGAGGRTAAIVAGINHVDAHNVAVAKDVSDPNTPRAIAPPASSDILALNAVDHVVSKVSAGQPLTKAEMAGLPRQLVGVSDADLASHCKVLGLPSAANPAGLIHAAVAKAYSYQPGASAPAGPVLGAKPAATYAPTAAKPGALPAAPVGAAAYLKPSPATFKIDDRGSLEQAVREDLRAAGMSPQEALDSGYASTLHRKLASRIKGGKAASMGPKWDVERAIKNLVTQQATKILKPMFDTGGGGNMPNHSLPDGSRPKLTTAEQVAVQRYTGSAYRALNNELRSSGSPNAEHSDIHDGLQSAFQKAKPFAAPVDCIRGVKLKPAALKQLLSLANQAHTGGTPLMLPGYTSAEFGNTPDPFFNGNATFHIKAVHGLDMKPYSHYAHTNEILLNHGSQFKVTGVTKVGTGWHINLEQIPPAAAAQMPAYNVAPPNVSAWGEGVWKGNAQKRAAKAAPKILVGKGGHPAGTPATHKFSSIHDSTVVRDILSGKVTHALHSGIAGGREDKALTEMMDESGRSGLPTIVDDKEIDRLQSAGWRVCYRGIGAANGKSSKQNADQFRVDPHMYNGAGVFGNGTYSAYATTSKHKGNSGYDTDSAKAEAASYARKGSRRSRSGRGGGTVIRFAVPPTARVVEHDDLQKEQQSEMSQLDQQRKSGKITTSEYDKLAKVISDLGRFATLKNYDAIVSPGNNYFVLLNRSIAHVSDKDVK
jgi:hypothetical protein